MKYILSFKLFLNKILKKEWRIYKRYLNIYLILSIYKNKKKLHYIKFKKKKIINFSLKCKQYIIYKWEWYTSLTNSF